MELTIKSSIIDYSDVVNGGVNIIFTLTLEDDFTFEGMYWIHPNGNYTMEVEDRFLKLFGVETTDDLPFLDDLNKDVESILPPKEEIFEEFLNKNINTGNDN